MNKKLKIFIAGGGTGGHIYPALGIAKALERLAPDCRIEFVGTKSGMEGKIIPQNGYPIHFVEGGKLNLSGRWLEKLKTLMKLPLGLLQSAMIILKKKPDYVLGVGGYASGPFVFMASLLGRSTGIWEPNAQPGLANRILSRFVGDCFLVYEEAKSLLVGAKRIQVEGMPVREEIDSARPSYGDKGLAGEGAQFQVLCFGGSQGSRVINHALADWIDAMLANSQMQSHFQAEGFSGLKIVHQIGSTDWSLFKERYARLQLPSWFQLDAREFIHDMPKQYQESDVAICRGGASTLAEICAFGVPPIIIPLPAADNHQEKNAESLRAKCGAEVLLQRDLSSPRLGESILKLMRDKEGRIRISKALRAQFQPKASDRIASAILEVISWQQD